MNYGITEEQTMIKDAAHKFLAKECPAEFVRAMVDDERGYTDKIWQGMAELGWMSLLIPEEYDGFGGNFLDLMVLLSEMGYFALPGPFFSSVVLGGLTVMEAGDADQKQAILPGLAMGERILTLAWTEMDGLFTPEAIRLSAALQGEEYVLTGAKLFVPDAHVADTIITAARTGPGETDVSLFLVEAGSPGLTLTALTTMAGDKQFEVVYDGVKAPKSALLGELNQGWAVLRKVQLMAAVAKCAEMMGGAQKAMDLTIPWTKERVQFGRLIGSFQAIQHHLANMLTFKDTLTYMTYQASWRIAAGLPFEKEASMCKAWVSDSYRQAVAIGHQVLGGLGFMKEHDMGLYYKRAREAEMFFGDADFHRELVARELGL
ncbi:MAG: acyl-CoA/acyl-ACP dehydrogenase [Proteobacteria bacterium]|nr:acyl-CoA/acyl-ACP dehydrogenase [Pseudomonadota bacterium]